MKERPRKHEQERRKKWVRSVHYRFLLPSNVPMPDLRVDAECWDRIVKGLPNGYKLPDDLFVQWLIERVKTREQVQADEKAEAGGGDG